MTVRRPSAVVRLGVSGTIVAVLCALPALANASTPRAPSVSSVSPKGGLPSGSTRVTIRGANFTTGTKVKFGAIAATSVHVVSAAEVEATSPAHPAGTVDVRLTTPGGTSAVVAGDRFTYLDAPDAVGLPRRRWRDDSSSDRDKRAG
jgi:hypothetical protein